MEGIAGTADHATCPLQNNVVIYQKSQGESIGKIEFVNPK